MNAKQSIRIAVGTGWLFLRHAVAILATVAALCALWTVIYMVLLLWAIAAGLGLGSPVTYPLGLFICLVGSTAFAVVFYLPSVVLAEWLGGRYRLAIFAQIPISAGILGLLCLLVVSVWAMWVTPASLPGAAGAIAVLFLANLLPLGLYWWVAQSGPLVIALYRRVRRYFELKPLSPHPA